jgi:hypothetical protein
MQPVMQLWMPAILSVFGSLMVVVITAWLNTKALSAQIEAVRSEITSTRSELRAEIQALRAETRQGFAELRLEFHGEISGLGHRVERLEEARHGGLLRP